MIRAMRGAACALLAVTLAAGCASRTPSPPSSGPPSRSVPLPSGAPVPVPPPVTQIPAPAPIGRFADVNGTRLYYELAGPVTAETVVLIHHFTLDLRMWDDQFNEFARRYRVLRYDARGFGRSGQINGAYSARDDLRALLDALGIQRAHLVGHSMGGRYAIDFALVHPTRVRTLVLSDPSISGAPFSGAFTKEFGNAVTAARAGD